jgi:hypothetical protein
LTLKAGCFDGAGFGAAADWANAPLGTVHRARIASISETCFFNGRVPFHTPRRPG